MDREKIEGNEMNKTGLIVDTGFTMENPRNKRETMYVFGVMVSNIVYKCHYTTSDRFNFEKYDYIMFKGTEYDVNVGFYTTSLVRIDNAILLKRKNFEKISNDYIVVTDFRIKGRLAKLDEPNGFVIKKENTIYKRYGIFYIYDYNNDGTPNGKCLGLYDTLTQLMSGCIDVASKYNDKDYEHIRVMDTKRQIDELFVDFIKGIENDRRKI